MITYERGGIHFLLKIFRWRGSVFPFSFCIAFPCAMTCAAVKWCIDSGYLEYLENEDSPGKAIMTDNIAFSGFSFLVGFLIVFRTSQAYARFWDGCTSTHQMRAEWFDACSSVVAFCKHSKCDKKTIMGFQECIVRLFSMLHATALAEIEDINSDSAVEEIQAFKYELIDAEAIDGCSLEAIKESDAKVELVFQWIQQLIVENIETGVLSIPPPILSRSFQELAQGMVHFHDAIKISNIPFPFPYAQTCDCLLVLHWIITPFIVATSVSHPAWAGIFSFFSVFILWSLNAIAVEIENPFGMDDNDIDACSMQEELNKHLSLLLDAKTHRTPTIQCGVRASSTRAQRRNSTFMDAWRAISQQGIGAEEPIHRTSRTQAQSRRMRRSGSGQSLGSKDSCDSVALSLQKLENGHDRGSRGSRRLSGSSSHGKKNSQNSVNEQFRDAPSVITIHSDPEAFERDIFPDRQISHDRNEHDMSPSASKSSKDTPCRSSITATSSKESPSRDGSPYRNARSPRAMNMNADRSIEEASQSQPPSSERSARADAVRPARAGPRISREGREDASVQNSNQTSSERKSGSDTCQMNLIGGQALGGWTPAPCTYTPPEG
mmetsp:Transcript_3343/g.6101  ORF Transcript_3343/g.6101 Transcript_3343/m.6101 type:complete len:606 (-) Transcript_3343:22-1839(-)